MLSEPHANSTMWLKKPHCTAVAKSGIQHFQRDVPMVIHSGTRNMTGAYSLKCRNLLPLITASIRQPRFHSTPKSDNCAPTAGRRH